MYCSFASYVTKLGFVVDGYPSEPVTVIVTNRRSPGELVAELRQYLADSNKTGLMTDYLEITTCWLTDHYRQLVSESVEPMMNKCKAQKKKTVADTEKESRKKESMKTADDVIKRIQWDSNLEPEAFTVGYLDRFTGLTEKDFSNFSWEDLASVDYTVLAIPKHRIQYFKYKDVIVWDKTKRLDNVFGSAGSKVTITDVMADYVEKKASCQQNDETNCLGEKPQECNDNNISCDSDDDDDSDDGVCVTIDSKQDVYEEGSDREGEQDLPWQNKLRPNYFLCQRIMSPEVLENVETMQNQILDLDSRYISGCINPCMLHVTLCTLGLYQPEHITEVAEILQQNREELADMARSGINVTISGVGNFFQRVVYGKVNHDEKFTQFVEHVRSLIRESGINICDNYDFIPHMTILKVIRPVARQVGSKKVPSWMYEDFAEMEFGSQAIDGIYLCAMKGEKTAGKFYESPAHINLI